MHLFSSISQRAAVLRGVLLCGARVCVARGELPSDQKLSNFSTFEMASSTCSWSVMSETPPSRSRTSENKGASARERKA